MKKIISTLLLSTTFFACTKEKSLPATQQEQQGIKTQDESTVTSIKPLSDTSNKESVIKKKVAKVKYPKQKPQKK